MSGELNIIAEIGGNHLGDLNRAYRLIDAAYDAGATHVKFQCFTPEQMVGDPDYVLDDGPWKGRRLLDLYQETHTPREWFPELFAKAWKHGLTPFASVFHKDDVDFLEKLDCELYKISSFELVDLELIEHAALTGKQLLLSTGMATDLEIHYAANITNNPPILMACTSAYPANPADASLVKWVDQKLWGLSDHTPGCGVAAAAVALGATWIEKHLNLDGEGPDSAFSLKPDEFHRMVTACYQANAAIGPGGEAEKSSLKLRRSLWWARDLQPGDVITREDIKCCRPADGLPPADIDNVIGGIVIVPVYANTPISSASRHYE